MPRGENRPSILLSREENELVFGLIGPKCQSLASAVVQLFTTEGPGHSEWKKKDTGVLCLIKDNSKRSYFFRIYCLYRKAMIWEHEVYMQIEYKSPRTYLHTFEAEEYMTAFNFANEDEAKILRNILIEKIELRKNRREERRQRAQLAQRANSTASSHSSLRQNGVAPPPVPPEARPAAPAPAPSPALPPKAATPMSGVYTIKNSSKKPKARKLTKADIGMPQDFKHISHVGWDANKGFDVDNLPEEEMRSFFSKAGISDTQLQDHATRQFIYDFINTHGGLDAVKEELHDAIPGKRESATSLGKAAAAPPVPARSPAPHHPPHPPAPPSRAPPPPPARAVPPPPPPPAPAAPAAPRNPPPPRPLQPPTSAPPCAPPPPPPPPPPGAPPPPPPAPPAPAPPPPPPDAPPDAAPPPPALDARSALMESIRSGAKGLKKVEAAAPKPAAEPDSRNNLLSEIRQGIELRAVSKSNHGGTLERPPPSAGCGLADALKRALDERSRVIHSDTDSDESHDNDSGDDWD